MRVSSIRIRCVLIVFQNLLCEGLLLSRFIDPYLTISWSRYFLQIWLFGGKKKKTLLPLSRPQVFHWRQRSTEFYTNNLDGARWRSVATFFRSKFFATNLKFFFSFFFFFWLEEFPNLQQRKIKVWQKNQASRNCKQQEFTI